LARGGFVVIVEVKKELLVKVKLPELELEARVVITPKGEVEMNFRPWNQWNLSGGSFEQLVEDYNLIKSQIKLCVENLDREQLKAPPRQYKVEK
jgi:hypothetical protein